MNELFYLLVVEQKLGCSEVGEQAPHVAELNIACQYRNIRGSHSVKNLTKEERHKC
jgi:hypothetical protein